MNTTKIHITSDLLENTATREFSGEFVQPPVTLGYDTYSFPEPCTFDVRITNTGGALLVQGDASGVAHTSCARCLEDAAIDVLGDVEGFFVIPGEDAAPQDISADEFEMLPDDKTIDLAPLIVSAFLIELPQIPLCKPDCLGICAGCGADLNNEPCTCADAGVCGAYDVPKSPSPNNPFAALKDYKFE